MTARKTRMEEIFEQIPPQAMEVVNEKLLSGTPASDVARLLNKYGHSISESSVKAHRRRIREEKC